MDHDARLIPRLIDGDLSRHEADAMERAALDRPELATRLRQLRQLHADLGGAARPLGGEQQHHPHPRTGQPLPTTRPQPYARIRPIDLVMAGTALALVVMSYALFGSMVRGSL